VWIDHLASSLHCNSGDHAGTADSHAFLFHDEQPGRYLAAIALASRLIWLKT